MRSSFSTIILSYHVFINFGFSHFDLYYFYSSTSFVFFLRKEEVPTLECYMYGDPFPDQIETYEVFIYEKFAGDVYKVPKK